MPDLYISSDDKPPVTVVEQAAPAPAPSPSQSAPTTVPGQVDLDNSEPHILASFHENPEGIHFANQETNEEILLFLRKHYITNVGWQTATVVFAILPLLAFAIYPYLGLSFIIPTQFIVVLVLFYYIIVFGYAFISFVVWFYNVGIVSTQRVIDIDINGINSKDVAATELRDIIDISFKQSGFQQSLFDYGDVFMETQAQKPNFEFLNIPHPAKVTDIIGQLTTKKTSMTLPDLAINLPLIIKILFLIIIGMYAIFVFIVFTNIRSLNKLVLVERSSGSKLITILTFSYLLLTIFLFGLALVIL